MKLDIFGKGTKDNNLELRNYTKVESFKNQEYSNKCIAIGNGKKEEDNKIRCYIGANSLNNAPFFIETGMVSKDQQSRPFFAAEQEKRRRYWRTNFIIVLLPLVIYGVPIHLLLFGKRGISSVSGWFRQIFIKDPLPLRILTYILFIGGLCLNGFLIFVWCNLVTDLVIKGLIKDSSLKDFMTIVRVLPIVVPLDLFWIYGYSIRRLLKSFDRITYPEEGIEKCNLKPIKKWKDGWARMCNYRTRLACVYLLLLVNQLVHILIMARTNKAWKVSVLYQVFDFTTLMSWINLAQNFMYTLMLPIYICLSFAVHFEFERLSFYLKSLIRCGVHPNEEHLGQVKKYFKQVGNHVLQINEICHVYYAWVFFVLFAISLYEEILGILGVIVGMILASLMKQELHVDPSDVRTFVGSLIGGATQLLLFGITIWYALKANEQGRLIQVRLNDIATEPWVNMTPELFRKFDMLKSYIHSRMETEAPTLLRIAGLSFIPFSGKLHNTMGAYHVKH